MANQPVSHRETRHNTKRVPCSGPSCALRRVHHERPDTPRGQQYLWVRADHDTPVFCTLECHMYYKGTREQYLANPFQLLNNVMELERKESAARAEVILQQEKIDHLVDEVFQLDYDGIISAGKVREITGMRHEEQRERWRADREDK